MSDADEVRELRELLAVVVEALTPPHAATMAGADRRRDLIAQRSVHVAIGLQSVLTHRSEAARRFNIDFLREKLAERPADGLYVTAETAEARQAAGESYKQSVREDFPSIDLSEERS